MADVSSELVTLFNVMGSFDRGIGEQLLPDDFSGAALEEGKIRK